MKTQEKNKTKNKNNNPFKKSWNGIPATVRWSVTETSLYESFAASIFWHIAMALLIWLISFLFMFFGLTPKLFPHPKPKVNDLEFVIKDSPRHRVHYRKILAKQSTMDADKAVNNEPKEKNNPTPAAANPKPQPPKKDTNSNKFSLQNINKSFAKPAAKGAQKSKSAVPDFAMPMPKLKSISSGLGGSGTTKHRAAGVDSISNSSGGFDRGSSAGKGSAGSSGFDKNTTRKMITTYDISPYISELRRNIRWNWTPPTGSGNKRVELFLRIAKDGKIIILNVKKTSEVGAVDNAALSAVRKCVPLNPLPSKYSKSYLDVIFTFDANSISSR